MSSTNKISIAAVALMVSLTSCTPAPKDDESAPAISQVVSFGDSLTDAGTFGSVYGTTNGGSWSQLLAEKYGDEQKPNRTVKTDADGRQTEEKVGGLNYSEGGANVSPIGKATDVPRDMEAQVTTYLSEHQSFKPEQLVTMWAGGNDILDYLGHGDPKRESRFISGSITPDELAKATSDIVSAARREASLAEEALQKGAEKVVVVNIVDLGVTDMAIGIGPAGRSVASALTTTFNLALENALPKDSRVRLIDAETLFENVEKEPAKYGFKVVNGNACKTEGYFCGPSDWATPDADRTYAFAGIGHFTAASRELIADAVHKSVEEAWSS